MVGDPKCHKWVVSEQRSRNVVPLKKKVVGNKQRKIGERVGRIIATAMVRLQ
jgi:hypothetical protein